MPSARSHVERSDAKPQLVSELVGDFVCDAPVESKPIVKLGRHFIAVAPLEHPFVDAHQPDAKPAVLLADLLNLLIGQVRPERPAEQKLGGEFKDCLELVDALDASHVDAAKVAHIGVVTTDDLGAGIPQSVALLLKQVERESRFSRRYGLQHIPLE